MEFLALGSTVISIVVGCMVGATLLRRASRTRQLPEFAIGIGLLAFCALARPLSIAAETLGDTSSQATRILLLSGSTIGSGLGVACLLLFTCRVFQPSSRWATGTLGVGLAAILVTRIGIVKGFVAVPENEVASFASAPFWVGLSVVIWTSGYIWAAAESLRYYGMLRRRLRLGLADPVVTNRFLLWGIGCAVAGLVSASLIATTAAGMDVHGHPVPQLLMSITGFVGPITWYLGFAPPDGYLRLIRRRARPLEA
jgi:hypothetical protein